MDQYRIDTFLASNAKNFDNHLVPHIHDSLQKIDDTKYVAINSIGFKDPMLMQVISVVGGSVGIDRFVIGDTGLGICKLLTCGGFGIWTIVDWFLIQDRSREVNFQNLQRVLY